MAKVNDDQFIVTAGSSYLDIDAYACCVAMKELLTLKGQKAIAFSRAPCNYSVCDFLKTQGEIVEAFPQDISPKTSGYIIVDVSDPDYIRGDVPLDRVVGLYDHHTGFEDYWKKRIGERAHIEFIGAAATLVYREWKSAGLEAQMSRSTALLLIAAILDNTLDLTSANTAESDREAFCELCAKERVGDEWRAAYFSEVQKNVEADLKSALFSDLKYMSDTSVLPPRVAQLCVWDAFGVLGRLSEIREWFADGEAWMINIIDLKNRCGFFVCDDMRCQKKLERIFGVAFSNGVAKSPNSYLRKEIIKKTCEN